MDTVTIAQDNSPDATPSSIKSEDSTPPHDSGRGSPPPNCAICLGTCRNKSFTDCCLHQFCFKCLLTWSKVKAECPLCKQNFKSIIHNVRSNHQYEEYILEQTERMPERIDMDNLTSVNRRFRYRTTLTLPRHGTLAIQQLLLQYPLMAGVLPPPAPPAPRRRSPTAYRRTVYRHNLWARPLPDFTGRFRDCTPEFYRNNASQMHRLVPWLNRELHYLLNENVGHIAYVIARIMELLPRVHLTSPDFRAALQPYFGERTEHFLHELYCFASTPFDLAGYDRNVHYTTDTRLSTMVTELSSTDSDSADSDIVMVSSSHPAAAAAEPPPGPSRASATSAARAPPAAAGVIPIETISHSDSDDSNSEVMVVGYIKPPAERTPEIVDLLGSDSDVMVQEDPVPAPAPRPLPVAPAPAPSALVRLSLKRAAPAAPPRSPDLEWRPPSRTASSSASTASRSASDASADLSASSSSSSSSSSTSSPSPPRRKYRKKMKSRRRRSRSSDAPGPSSSRHRRRERTSRRKRRYARSPDQRRDKRKSSSGRGVKSSRRVEPAPAPATELPNGSGADEAGGERRRLRSVVNVMNAWPAVSEAAGSAPGSPAWTPPLPPPHLDSDSSDDRPLNLSLHKATYTQL